MHLTTYLSAPSFQSPTKLIQNFPTRSTILSSKFLSNHFIFLSKLSTLTSFTCSYSKNKNTNDDDIFQEFSVLSSEVAWEEGSIWSTMGLYFFSLHIPLSFGGLSVVAKIMNQAVLDPQIEAVSILLIQTIELCGAFSLLKYTAKPNYKLASFFQGSKFSKERNWVQAAAVGFGLLALLALLTSFLADRLIGPKDVNNPILKDIISSGSVSGGAVIIVYFFVTPFLEEIVYRGFLLTSLASRMKWQQAVIISSCIFSVAHFSNENSFQLFIIGCILGCSYCWSGNLSSSFVLHSLYNAATLMVTVFS
ncbi:hypothetical protein IFM89_007811 [Coptis chinensis]|uniref:CAAX prenyl protease 2/Lysostaphin resistance protein A-like domain-containing protein n=1 Tax=Coptis chinensis TaxID=261450 RepID=A0A835GYC2_9MAGN|nr:hypothetical protein IFM89_007811 [Coptis chinensis]